MRALLLMLLLATPCYAKTKKAEPDQRTRRYKMKDIQAKDPGARDRTKLDSFMYVVGSIGLAYFWPGRIVSVDITKDNR